MTGELNFYAVVRCESGHELQALRLHVRAADTLSEAFEQQAAHFFDPDEMDVLDFDPDYHPTEYELFKVDHYQLPSFYNVLRKTPVNVPSVSPSTVDGSTKAIFGVRRKRGGHLDLYFQKFRRSQALRRQGVVSVVFKKDEFNLLDEQGIQFQNRLDAMYSDGALLFRSAHNIAGFLEVASLYEEATDEEVNRFRSLPLFAPTEPERIQWLCDGPRMRKLVTAVMARGIVLSVDPTDLQSIAAKYGLEISMQNVRGKKRVVLPDNRPGFRELMKFLNDDYLQSSLSQEQYAVNSKRRL